MSASARPLRIGLIGNNLDTSLSPAIHEAEAGALGLAGFRYEAIDLAGSPDPDLGAVLEEALAEGFTGFNITHPYKQAIMPFLDEVAPGAEALGAVNTVVLEDGRLVGHNTDRSGFLAGLRRTLPGGTGCGTVVLFGAGGAGSAVAAALLDFGVRELRIIDPEEERLEQLSGLLRRSLPVKGPHIETGGPELAEEWMRTADGVVNATPIGMEHIPGTPFDTAWLRPTQWVADVIYRPVQTALLEVAATRGCQVVNGTTMLIEQAADTFVLVTGCQPDRGRMRAHLAQILAPVSR